MVTILVLNIKNHELDESRIIGNYTVCLTLKTNRPLLE